MFLSLSLSSIRSTVGRDRMEDEDLQRQRSLVLRALEIWYLFIFVAKVLSKV